MADRKFEITLPIDTPLYNDGAVHTQWYEKMIEWYFGLGVTRFLIDGTTGGWPGSGLFQREERQAAGVRKVKQLGGYAALNIASGSADDSIYLASRMSIHQPDICVVMLPGVPKNRSDADIVEFCREISCRLGQSNVPWGLYEFGGLLGVRFTPATLREILQFDNPPKSIKWTNSENPFEALRIAEQFHNDRFRVIPSHELAIELSIQAGLPEFVSGALVPLPELAAAFMKFAKAQDKQKIQACQALMTSWLNDMNRISSKRGRDFFKAIKAALAFRHEGYPLLMSPGVAACDDPAIGEFGAIIPGYLSQIAAL